METVSLVIFVVAIFFASSWTYGYSVGVNQSTNVLRTILVWWTLIISAIFGFIDNYHLLWLMPITPFLDLVLGVFSILIIGAAFVFTVWLISGNTETLGLSILFFAVAFLLVMFILSLFLYAITQLQFKNLMRKLANSNNSDKAFAVVSMLNYRNFKLGNDAIDLFNTLKMNRKELSDLRSNIQTHLVEVSSNPSSSSLMQDTLSQVILGQIIWLHIIKALIHPILSPFTKQQIRKILSVETGFINNVSCQGIDEINVKSFLRFTKELSSRLKW